MTTTAIIFFMFGAIVLWGGLITTLSITIHKEKQAKKEKSEMAKLALDIK